MNDRLTFVIVVRGASVRRLLTYRRPGLLALIENSTGAPGVMLDVYSPVISDRANKANPVRKGSGHRWQ